jgi:hypothetical protein
MPWLVSIDSLLQRKRMKMDSDELPIPTTEQIIGAESHLAAAWRIAVVLDGGGSSCLGVRRRLFRNALQSAAFRLGYRLEPLTRPVVKDEGDGEDIVMSR